MPFVLLLLGTALAGSPEPLAPSSSYSPMTSLAPLVEAVLPAVLVLEVDEAPMQLPGPLRDFLDAPEGERSGEGSGFVISADGLALTNAHVVADAVSVRARLADGSTVPVRVLGRDDATDIALVALPSDRVWPYVELGSSADLRLGDWVVAVGNPLGLGHTVTAGVVSGKGRVLGQNMFGSDAYIQTDAAINQGNSGGPLFDLHGHVVGVANSVIAGANSVGFAIPADLVTSVYEQLRDHGRVARGFIGVRPEPLTPGRAKELGVRAEAGAVVGAVFDDTPAQRGGLEQGDVVIAVDDDTVEGPRDLITHIARHRPGDSVRLTLIRGKRQRVLEVVLAERPGEDRSQSEPQPRRRRLSLDGSDGLVRVVGVAPDSPLDGHLLPGDEILEINGRRPLSTAEVHRELEAAHDAVTLQIRRRGETLSVQVPPER